MIKNNSINGDCLQQPCSAGVLRYAANEVAKLATHLVGNTKTDGTRDSIVYEQGIGCERASKMLMEEALIIERIAKGQLPK